MSTQLQLKRGNTTANNSFIGAEAEITVDSITHELHVHDGVTQGGHVVAKKEDVYSKTDIDTTLGNYALSNDVYTKTEMDTTLEDYALVENTYTKAKTDELLIRNITNCIAEIPQNIKLELNNDTLTLKAGSKLYIPNGPGVFDEITIASDLTHSFTGSAPRFAYYDSTNNELRSALASNTNSGTTPSGTGLYYNTSTNNIDYLDNGTGRGYKASFPLCISNSDVSAIDQIFNGFGYIGSTMFVFPGIKLLIPNGKNEDNTPKSTQLTTNIVITHTQEWGNYNYVFYIDDENSQGGSLVYQYKYDKDNNHSYISGSNQNVVILAEFKATNNNIDIYKPRTVFQALDYNDTNFLANQAMPSDKYIDLTLGISGAEYMAPADGYFVVAITDSGYAELTTTSTSSTASFVGGWARAFIPVKKGTVMTLYYGNVGTWKIFRFYYAQGAQ